MRKLAMLLTVITLITWGVTARGQTPPATAERPYTLIPTAFEELKELRVNTGRKAVLRDGTMNAVYVKNIPSPGNIYLNFHVDVASKAGPFDLHLSEIYLQGPAFPSTTLRAAIVKSQQPGETPGAVSYAPVDWFIDTGSDEVRGDPLTINTKAIVQFTVEVPQAGFDDLTLFVGSQRMGTVREIRAQIARDRGLE